MNGRGGVGGRNGREGRKANGKRMKRNMEVKNFTRRPNYDIMLRPLHADVFS